MRAKFLGALVLSAAGASWAAAEPSLLVRMALTGPQTPYSAAAEEQSADADDKGDKEAPPKLPDGKTALPAPTEKPTILDHAPAGDCCAPCCCKPEPRTWASVEGLLWWLRDQPLAAPLLTTGANGGIIGDPTTNVLIGGTGLNYQQLGGFRVTAGSWLNQDRTFGAEANFFMLEQGVSTAGAASDATGSPVLTIPIIDAQTGLNSGVAVGLPGAFAGSVAVKSTSRLWGSEANGIANITRNGNLTVDALAGFRYLQLEERLSISRSASVLPGGNRFFLGAPVPGPSIANIADEFGTQNRFYGGQLGTRVEWKQDRFSVSLLGKVALGVNHGAVNAGGATSLLVPGAAPVTVPAGLFVGPSNFGRRTQNEFTFVPEVGVHLGYQITERIRVFGGYTFLYWNHIARPGSQIDPAVNLTQFPLSPTFGPAAGPAQPAPLFNHQNFWAQGIDLGVGISF